MLLLNSVRSLWPCPNCLCLVQGFSNFSAIPMKRLVCTLAVGRLCRTSRSLPSFSSCRPRRPLRKYPKTMRKWRGRKRGKLIEDSLKVLPLVKKS